MFSYEKFKLQAHKYGKVDCTHHCTDHRDHEWHLFRIFLIFHLLVKPGPDCGCVRIQGLHFNIL
jgi:hypothetical protein